MSEQKKSIWSRLVPTGVDAAGKETYRLDNPGLAIQADFHTSTQNVDVKIDTPQDLEKIAIMTRYKFANTQPS